MRKLIGISFLLCCFVSTRGQQPLRTIVPPSPLIAGESFQVQYVVENMGKEDQFIQPDFKSFRFVSGPNVYTGAAYSTDGPVRLANVVFTLVAVNPGKYFVPGAIVTVGGNRHVSENVQIEVISKAEAIRRGIALENAKQKNDYFLAPDEDPNKKIRENLFLRLSVDRKTCYIGQPVTATFKLYSRLNSKSDIVKNPGFYGFTVQDMIGLTDNLITRETINGRKFDVHTVRKVQLYPLQSGEFTIDPMEVQNTVEFSRSAVIKKTEQEIVEGVFNSPVNENNLEKDVFESSMRTDPIKITVKAPPLQAKPANYSGATGRFTISASLEKKELGKNEEGTLILKIEGKGNFNQITSPVVDWPKGIEGFEPEVKDSLNNSVVPLKGSKRFNIHFIADKQGLFIIPAIEFSFFDPDSNNYKIISTKPIELTVKNTRKSLLDLLTGKKDSADGQKGHSFPWLLIFIICLVMAAGVGTVFFLRRRKISAITIQQKTLVPSVDEILAPAASLTNEFDRVFYISLRRCIWDFISRQFELSGSNMSKSNLESVLNVRSIAKDSQEELLDILQKCEQGTFTMADTGHDKQLMLEKTRETLTTIRKQIGA